MKSGGGFQSSAGLSTVDPAFVVGGWICKISSGPRMRRTTKGPVKATHTVAIGDGALDGAQETGGSGTARRRGKSPGSHGGKNTRR